MVPFALDLITLVVGVFTLGWICGRRGTVWLRLSSLSFQPKPRIDMPTTNLRSPASQFAQIILDPIDLSGNRVKLDPDAIAVDILAGGSGVRSSVLVLDDADGGRRFQVSLAPADAPGESRFKIRGDGEPGEGVTILEEEYIYTGTPDNAANLNPSVTYLPKSSFPA